MQHDGGYTIRNNKIHVFGVVDGKRYRLSTGKDATKLNINWVKKRHSEVLLQLIDKKEKKKLTSKLEEFGLEILEITATRRDDLSQKDYLSKFKRLIVPYFKSYNLNDIKPLDIEKWQNNLLQKYSTVTVKKTKSLFKMILDKAVANDLINRNPIDLTDKIIVQHKKTEPYTVKEMSLILQNSEGWLKIFLYVAFTTGMRTGEIMGLQWNDIDFNRKIIQVKRAINKGRIKTSSSTKNHNRLIVLTDIVLNMLQKHKKTALNEWVFVSRRGEPFSESKAIANRYFKPLLKSIDIKDKTLYATRHTFTSIMRNEGVDTDLIIEMAGNSKEVSDKHYYSPTENAYKQEAVNNVFTRIGLIEFKS